MWVLLILALAVDISAECPRHCDRKWRSGKESSARAGLNAIPPRLDPTTQHLDLTENLITVLRDDAFLAAGLLNLQRLYILSCNLKIIKQFAFCALVNFGELNLCSNRIKNMLSQAFELISVLQEFRRSGFPYQKYMEDFNFLASQLLSFSSSRCSISVGFKSTGI